MIAEMIEGDALQTLVTNKLRGALTSVAVVTPEFGERRTRMLEDIAILTGGEPLTDDLGLTLETIQLAQLGQAKRVVVDRDDDDDHRRPRRSGARSSSGSGSCAPSSRRGARPTSTRASSASGWRG